MRTWHFPGIMILVLQCLNAEAQTIADQPKFPDGHCSVMQGTVDNKTFVCTVWDNGDPTFSSSFAIEVYRGSRLALTIKTDAPVQEWHYWNDDTQLSVHVGKRGNRGAHELFDLTTGALLDKVESPAHESELPQWAKGQSQLADESVPEGPQYSEERTLWIAKVLRRLQSISPGMRRRDLMEIFTTEGGLYAREQQTFVLKECRYIKVNVVFSRSESEEADDRIVKISGPYLGYGVMD